MKTNLVCTLCGQDWLTPYRIREDGREFLLCPECDSVWLPGDDPQAYPRLGLRELLPSDREYTAWDHIEPVE
jgi:hypothetical protein